ncbi:MAG TPA: methylmalonyl-CoA carboxyltransferase, partial [Edaphobacter sp.]|nr:methylmalonyl-CoA carboxyltransferase [Edaphobacter sp.]
MATAERPVPQTKSDVKIDSHQRNLAELAARHAIAEEGGGPERREREKKAGKLSARERVEF